MLAHQPTLRSIKTTPQALHTGLNTLAQTSTRTSQTAMQKLGPNTILGTPPPEIHHSELPLPCADRVYLGRLRWGHHTALDTYRKRIEWMIPSKKSAFTECITDTSLPIVSHTHHDPLSRTHTHKATT